MSEQERETECSIQHKYANILLFCKDDIHECSRKNVKALHEKDDGNS